MKKEKSPDSIFAERNKQKLNLDIFPQLTFPRERAVRTERL